MKGIVRCDSCHDEFNHDDVAKFHHANCIKCGYGPLISDEDLEVIQAMDALIDVGLASQEPDAKGFDMTIDTGPMRNA
jgi:hypothetical protein